MPVSIRPRVTLSADGSAAVVTAAAGRVSAYDVASGELRAEHAAVEVHGVALSAGGSALALSTGGGELLVHHGGGWLPHRLPAQPAAFAISDDGARAVVAIGVRPGRAELWRLGEREPEATAEVGDGGRAELQADGDLLLILAWTGDAPAGPTPTALLAGQDGRLARVDGFPGPDPAAATAVHGGCAWVVGPEAVTVWTARGEAERLPGTLRDRVATAPGGRHVLLHRAEADAGGGAARVLLRAFALPDLEPAGEADAEIADHSFTAIALTDELEVRAVRATEDGEIAVERVASL